MRANFTRVKLFAAFSLSLCSFLAPQAFAQDGQENPVISVCELVRMSCHELDTVYRRGTVPAIPSGRLRGTTIVRPGTPLAPSLSKAAGVVWQGKVFDSSASTAVNRFFGIRAIRASVYHDESYVDGQAALILDYSQTSFVYRKVRDEIREVAPGVYLGVMYRMGDCEPEFRRFFILEGCFCE